MLVPIWNSHTFIFKIAIRNLLSMPVKQGIDIHLLHSLLLLHKMMLYPPVTQDLHVQWPQGRDFARTCYYRASYKEIKDFTVSNPKIF